MEHNKIGVTDILPGQDFRCAEWTNTECIKFIISRIRGKYYSSLNMESFEKTKEDLLNKKTPMLFEAACIEQFLACWKKEFNDDVISMGQLDMLLKKYYK